MSFEPRVFQIINLLSWPFHLTSINNLKKIPKIIIIFSADILFELNEYYYNLSDNEYGIKQKKVHKNMCIGNII